MLAGKMAGEITVVHGLSREFEKLAGIPPIRAEEWDFDAKLARLLDDDGGFREVAGKKNDVGIFQLNGVELGCIINIAGPIGLLRDDRSALLDKINLKGVAQARAVRIVSIEKHRHFIYIEGSCEFRHHGGLERISVAGPKDIVAGRSDLLVGCARSDQRNAALLRERRSD